MNANAQAYNQYKKTSIETVAPEKLLLMLFDGAFRNINNAKKAITEGDINRAHQEIVKTEDIIIELMTSLNMDYEISVSLLALYEYLLHQLTQANFKKDISLLDEVQGFVSELRDTWGEAVKSLNTVQPVAVNKSEPVIKSINVKG